MFLKASQTIEQSTGLSLGGRRASTHLLDTNYTGEELDSEQEMENYLVCVVALHRLMQIEQSLMRGIIPLPHQPRVFELVIRESMDVIVQDGEVCKNKTVRIKLNICFTEHCLESETLYQSSRFRLSPRHIPDPQTTTRVKTRLRAYDERMRRKCPFQIRLNTQKTTRHRT